MLDKQAKINILKSLGKMFGSGGKGVGKLLGKADINASDIKRYITRSPAMERPASPPPIKPAPPTGFKTQQGLKDFVADMPSTEKKTLFKRRERSKTLPNSGFRDLQMLKDYVGDLPSHKPQRFKAMRNLMPNFFGHTKIKGPFNPVTNKKYEYGGRRLESYVNPNTGYTHTVKEPGWGRTAFKSFGVPRLFKDPKYDRYLRNVAGGSFAWGVGTATGREARGAYDDVQEHDRTMNDFATKARLFKRDDLARIAEAHRSKNILRRLFGMEEIELPDTSPLKSFEGTLNESAWPIAKEFAKQKAHSLAEATAPSYGTGESLPTNIKALFKPVLNHLRVMPAATRLAFGKPRSRFESSQTIIGDSLTPERVAELESTPSGRMMLKGLRKIQHTTPEEWAEMKRKAAKAKSTAKKAKKTYDKGKKVLDVLSDPKGSAKGAFKDILFNYAKEKGVEITREMYERFKNMDPADIQAEIDRRASKFM